MPGEDDYYQDAENIEFTHPTGNEEITIDVTSNDADNATQKNLGKGTLGTGFVLRVSATVHVLQIGSRVYKSPITVTTEGLSWTKLIKQFNTMVLRPVSDNTQIKLLVL